MAVRFQLVIDCTDPERLARWYTAADWVSGSKAMRPNKPLQPTPYSVRSCVAPASRRG